MPDLKLIALDAEDLSALSAHLQDAVVRVSDMAYVKAEKRFAAVVNRFDWQAAIEANGRRSAFERRRAGLRFERVLAAKHTNIDLANKTAVLSLLAVLWELTEEPEGLITLKFSGGGAIQLRVECIECELKDLGAAWSTRQKPEHAEEENPDDR